MTQSVFPVPVPPLSGIKSVQRGVANVSIGSTLNVTISPVNMNKAFVSWGAGMFGGSGALARVTLTSSTNVAIHYSGSFLAMGEIPWEVVEFH